MSIIHQLYATHCTYGSSAIERRQTGDARDRVLGYSARASSWSQSDLRRHFRTIERFLYYYLPKDAPPDKKTSLTPQTAPPRFFFSPSMSGLQALGLISYRQTDRAGRVGSYFAHVLAAEIARDGKPWDVIECLQLWNTPSWVKEDNDLFPYDLPALQTLSAMRPNAAPAVDERVLWSFLNTPPSGPFEPREAAVIPKRWRDMPVEERRQYFRLVLMGYLEVSAQPRESLLLLAEPSVAVLFFYGIARLLPPALRTALSFSTFETNADRLVTSLAAMTFDNESSGGDVLPERYRRGFVVNTWLNKASDLRDPQAQYAKFVLNSLLGGTKQDAKAFATLIDQKLAPFEVAEVRQAKELEELVKADLVTKQVLGLTPNLDPSWKKSEPQAKYVRKAVRQKLSGPLDTKFLEDVLKSPEYLPLILEIAVQGEGNDNCGPSTAYLVERVEPLERLDSLLGPGDVARGYKLHALRHYVVQRRELPKSCTWLWSEKPPAAHGPQKPLLAFDLLQSSCVTAEVIRSSLGVVPDAGLVLLFRGVLRSPLDATKKTGFLADITKRGQFDVIALMADAKADVGVHDAMLKAVLLPSLRQALNRIHEQPDRFAQAVPALEAAQPLLAGTPDADRVQAWGDLKRTLEAYQQDLANPQGGGINRSSRRKTWEFTDKVADCLDRCYPEQEEDCEALRNNDFKSVVVFFRQLAAAYQVDGLLPGELSRYLWAYFRRDAKTMNGIKQTSPLAGLLDQPLRIAGGAAAAVVVVLLLLFGVPRLISLFGGKGDKERAEEPPAMADVNDKGDGATPEPKPPTPEPKPPTPEPKPPTPEPKPPTPEPKPPTPEPKPPTPEPKPPTPEPKPPTPEPKPPTPEPKPPTPEPKPPTPEPKPPTPEPKPPTPEPKPAAEPYSPDAIAEEPVDGLDVQKKPKAVLCNAGVKDCELRIYGEVLKGEVLERDGGYERTKKGELVKKNGRPVKITLRTTITGASTSTAQAAGNEVTLSITTDNAPQFPVARFYIEDDSLKYELLADEKQPWLPLVQERLALCLVELKPQAGPSRYIAMQKPRPLKVTGESVDVTPVPIGTTLCLGRGRVTIKDTTKPYEFGEQAASLPPTDRWELSALYDDTGKSIAGLEGFWICLERPPVPESNSSLTGVRLAVRPEPDLVKKLVSEKPEVAALISKRDRLTALRQQLINRATTKQGLDWSILSSQAVWNVLLEFAELLDGNAGQLPRSPFVGAGPADTSANTVRQSLASQYLDGKFNNMTVEIEQKAGRDVVAAWKQTQEALQRVTSVEAEIYRIVDVGDGANKRSVRVRVMGLPQ